MSANQAPFASSSVKLLLNSDEIISASRKLSSLNLSGHHDPLKNWDLQLSIEALLGLDKRAEILDAGSGSKAVFANSMKNLGFETIYACDLQDIRVENIQVDKCDITRTPYKDDFFKAIGCLSVIEHGVNLKDFAKEMYRICAPGGKLIISTDFWPKHEDHSEKFPYGENNPSMMLFNNESIKSFFDILNKIGWNVPEFYPFIEFEPRPVYWERMNAHYTFLWFEVWK